MIQSAVGFLLLQLLERKKRTICLRLHTHERDYANMCSCLYVHMYLSIHEMVRLYGWLYWV